MNPSTFLNKALVIIYQYFAQAKQGIYFEWHVICNKHIAVIFK